MIEPKKNMTRQEFMEYCKERGCESVGRAIINVYDLAKKEDILWMFMRRGIR